MATFTFSKPWDLTISARDLKSSFITRALRVRRYSDFIITLIIILFLNLQWLKNWKLVQVSSSKSIFYLLFFWRIFSILELFSIDGAIRVISDDFSISLLNPESELYKYKADKYENMVSTTFYFRVSNNRTASIKRTHKGKLPFIWLAKKDNLILLKNLPSVVWILIMNSIPDF